MTPKTNVAPVIVVFGITGDLSKRKLLPAIYHLMRQSILPADTKLVGISRHKLEPADVINEVELCVLEKDQVCDPEGLKKIKGALQTCQVDPADRSSFENLNSLLSSFDAEDKQRERLIHMAIPASAYSAIVPQLAQVGLNQKRNRLLLEKPFGYDLASAEHLLELVHQHFDESQIYRIDHYLAKETAQNLMAFRMHNPIFVPLWSAEHISKVHVKAFETIGIQGRANFFEQTGILRDFTQSHLMQLLAITLMPPPADMSSQAIHASKQRFFEQLQPADPTKAVRAQYDSYKKEVNNPASYVETYARVELEHSSNQWKGTQIVLETGKGMATKTTEIIVEFKSPHEHQHNNLTFRLQPNEGISLDLAVKKPGFNDKMHYTSLDFDYAAVFDGEQIEAYERVLMDAIRGDQSLFASDTDVVNTWRVLQPLLDAWSSTGDDLLTYRLGADRPT